MALLFNDLQKQTTYYRNSISGQDLNSAALKESKDLFSLEHANMTFTNWCFDGFRLAFSQLAQWQPTAYDIRNEIDAVKIYFNIRGYTNIRYHQLSKAFTLKPGQFNMLYSAELESNMSHIDDRSEIFSLQLTPDCFAQLTGEGSVAFAALAENMVTKKPALFSRHWLPMNATMECCIADILECPFTGDLRKMYLHSKAVEMFVLFAHAAAQREVTIDSKLKSADRDKLYFVRDYLLQQYAHPLTLTGVARTAGLNEFRLKQGFKELFNTSVIDFLINHRLEKARELLLNTDKSISEVAYETGYSSAGYFSKAFRKKFGVSPGAINQR